MRDALTATAISARFRRLAISALEKFIPQSETSLVTSWFDHGVRAFLRPVSACRFAVRMNIPLRIAESPRVTRPGPDSKGLREGQLWKTARG